MSQKAHCRLVLSLRSPTVNVMLGFVPQHQPTKHAFTTPSTQPSTPQGGTENSPAREREYLVLLLRLSKCFTPF